MPDEESIIDPATAKVGKNVLRLRYSGRAQYRLQSIGKNIDFDKISHPRKGLVTMSNWAWACAMDCPFETPEEMAEALIEGQGASLCEALLIAVRDGLALNTKKKAG